MKYQNNKRRLTIYLNTKELYLSVIFNKLMCIESSLVRYQFNKDAFLKKIKEGRVEDLQKDEIEIFEKIIPRPNEVQKLREVILTEGYL